MLCGKDVFCEAKQDDVVGEADGEHLGVAVHDASQDGVKREVP